MRKAITLTGPTRGNTSHDVPHSDCRDFPADQAFRSFLVVLAGLAMPAAAEFTIPPYVQNPGTTTMTVMWEADMLDEATVTVGREAGDPEVITAPTTAECYTPPEPPRPCLPKAERGTSIR